MWSLPRPGSLYRMAMPVRGSMQPSLLDVEHLGKHFPGVQALHDVSLTLRAGEVHALVGQNGAGKSTLVKCISGVHPPDEGRIVFDGREITTYSPKHAYDIGADVVSVL